MSDWIVNQVDRLSSLLHDSVMFYVFFFVFFLGGGGGGSFFSLFYVWAFFNFHKTETINV